MVLLKEELFVENEVVDFNSSKDFFREHNNNECPSLITNAKFGVVKKVDQLLDKKERKKGIPIKNATNQGYLVAEVGDGVDISTRMEHHRGNVQKGSCQTLTTQGGENVGVVVDKNNK